MHVELSLPPLFRGEAARNGVDPFAQAVSTAALGCDPGLIVHNSGGAEAAAPGAIDPQATGPVEVDRNLGRRQRAQRIGKAE